MRAGFVQSLGWDMTRELHALRSTWNLDEAKRTGQERTFALVTKGVDYGKLTVFPDGRVDTSKVVGVDADLVVKPFGWKGNTARLRRFVEEASRIHFGVQSTILVEKHKLTPDVARLGNGKDWFDPDGDGITKELPEGVLTTGAVYMAMLESPSSSRPTTSRSESDGPAGASFSIRSAAPRATGRNSSSPSA
ncbi:MAG: hypothetical protein U0169_10150 [Polyangiaceae bacterium]